MENLSPEQVKKIVTDGYMNILRRWPDKGGMTHYSKLLSDGKLDPEQFCNILINSEEYNDKFGKPGSISNILFAHKTGQEIPKDKGVSQSKNDVSYIDGEMKISDHNTSKDNATSDQLSQEKYVTNEAKNEEQVDNDPKKIDVNIDVVRKNISDINTITIQDIMPSYVNKKDKEK